MATRADALPFAATRESAAASTAAVPWFIWINLIGVTSAIVGGQWDISWHRSIGRDTFWTPAHLAIYLCGILAGVSSAYLILATTFGKSLYPRDATVKMWGFRGPLGAFVTAWGGVAMLTSAPFDEWWHSAYGLDVKIVSPPHVLLIMGVLAIQTGALLLMLGYMNRAEGKLKRIYDSLFLYTGGMILLLMSVLILEFTNRVYMHSGFYYRTVGLAIPAVLVAVARASEHRWAATIVAGVYTVFMLGFQWILPLFPAEAKLGPVMNPVTHFVPPQFPQLYIFPALALDLIWPSIANRGKWMQALTGGLTFMTVFLAVQWPFADFLMSGAAKNWFFGSHYRDYATGPNSAIARGLFIGERTMREFQISIGLAFLFSILMSRAGLAWSDWMRRVQR
jgi:hypothetical protein